MHKKIKELKICASEQCKERDQKTNRQNDPR